jgi:nitrate/TMAO reductase-like tetraheme cytochrome c subunit
MTLPWDGAARVVTKAALKSLAIVIAAVVALVLGGAVYFTVRALARERPEVRPGTEHASWSRESCGNCHAPLAAEWRESFHFRSVTGSFWERVRAKGYAGLFATLRVACMNCHAPANVLDLAAGTHPVERSEAAESGVDCVSCHVSERGIVGPGRFLEAPHEVIADERFRDPALASVTVCAHCHDEPAEHARTVAAWQRTAFAADGVTCLHCHMPEVESPLVTGGPARRRRSHAFIADKNPEMLRSALNASIGLTGDRKAVVRITNDRVGHALPASGMNSLIVKVTVRGEDGRAVEAVERAFGSKEWIPGYLDFRPFLTVTKIPYGETRDVVVDLPSGHGEVTAEFRYRDWWTLADRDTVIGEIARAY